MTEEFLDDPQVSAIFQQVRCKAMPKHVRCYPDFHSSSQGTLFDSQPKRHLSKGRSPFCKENIGRRTFRHQAWPAKLQVPRQGCRRVAAYGHNTLLIAFPNDIDESAFELQLFQSQTAKFSQTKSRSIRQFENGLVAQGLWCFRFFGMQ